ncbi:DUF4302 domain-containing protein [Reichenbachiella carrageenanivorans]|uniref:DUF4302 domain-containing protein n=1 Tax=Reichenbachiella carrageenanivorans TaxID=2979869 RepID=A0ABY6CY00_9BACT|nr:DUF4302 domain-containing protein [Reichenbachiella carrageenanivorans]UXX78787.1 DUF4302 domain-containing protein [Reichenbachiella carrageenanivorans]
MNKFKYLFIVSLMWLGACSHELEKLTPPEERSEAAIGDLINELTQPANGWMMNYQPTPTSGVFYMLMEFSEDGTVRIQSDVPGDNGYFFDQTIPYRIDASLHLELIFETYGVLHYLFEIDQSTFGAEFEFYYVGKQGDNIVLSSKTDSQSNPTELLMVPAIANAADALSQELSTNMEAYDSLHAVFTGPMQHIVLKDQISLFWRISPYDRVIQVRGAAVGTTTAEVVSINKTNELDHVTGYSYFDEQVVLTDPFDFTLDGIEYTISALELTNFSRETTTVCTTDDYYAPLYDGQVEGIGTVQIHQTLFDVAGLGFQPQAERYSVNVYYVLSDEGFSISEYGIIEELYPNATNFIFNYGFNDVAEPAYAVGLAVQADDGTTQVLLREFETTTTVENHVEVVFKDEATDPYYPATISAEDRANIKTITDEIFGVGGGTVYAAEIEFSNTEGLTIFDLYNPCTEYEFLLVQ